MTSSTQVRFRSFIAILVAPLIVLAIDTMNPKTACDRFVTSEDIKACNQRIKKIEPDSYLLALCEKQFDDDNFWECLELGNVANFDPKKMEKCESTEFNDTQRMDCLKGIADFTSKPSATFQRMPASGKSK